MSQGDRPLADAPDPRPVPPREPALNECCKGGCEPCVFDRYYEARERHHDALQDWFRRHPEAALEAGALPNGHDEPK